MSAHDHESNTLRTGCGWFLVPQVCYFDQTWTLWALAFIDGSPCILVRDTRYIFLEQIVSKKVCINGPPGLLGPYRMRWSRSGESVSSSWPRASRAKVPSRTEWFSNSSNTIAYSNKGECSVNTAWTLLDGIDKDSQRKTIWWWSTSQSG